MFIFEGGLLVKMDKLETEVNLLCKNCQHQVSMHLPNCTILSEKKKKTCDCNKPEFYNIVLVNISAGLKFIVTVVEN